MKWDVLMMLGDLLWTYSDVSSWYHQWQVIHLTETIWWYIVAVAWGLRTKCTADISSTCQRSNLIWIDHILDTTELCMGCNAANMTRFGISLNWGMELLRKMAWGLKGDAMWGWNVFGKQMDLQQGVKHQWSIVFGCARFYSYYKTIMSALYEQRTGGFCTAPLITINKNVMTDQHLVVRV
jgi:hypothetical protein